MPKRDLEARETGLAARDIHDELLEARANKAGQFFKHAANVVGNYEKGFWGLKRDLGERDMGDDMLEARANKAGQFVKNVAGAAGNYEKGFWGLRHDLGERDLGNDMLEPRANKAVQFFKTSPGVGNYEKGFRGLRRDLGERGVTAAQAAQAQMANQKAMQAADMRMQSSMANNNMLHTQKAHVARDLEFEERDLDDGLYERDFDGFEERDLEDFEGLEY
ncbi:hypothetical protein MMC26_000510 [Xylographa opegraphella]|nr:hypothetical protein [Xylographa opegraphella]